MRPGDPQRPDLIEKRQADLLRALGRPDSPSELASESFLEAIYQRAAEQAEAGLAEPLSKALTQVNAPLDVDWCEADIDSPVVAGMRQLPRRPAPGLLWPRIRAELRTVVRQIVRERRRSRRIRYVALAAVLLVSCLLVFQSRRLGFGEDGSGEDNFKSGRNLVIIRSIKLDAPFEDRYSQKNIVKKLTHGD